MAKNKTQKIGLGDMSININLLTSIANATKANSFVYVSKADGLPMTEHKPEPLIMVNTNMADDQGNVAARATDAGYAYLAQAASAISKSAGASVSSPYEVISNAVLPPTKRKGGGGGAPVVYPFDKLEVGGSFFVPVSEKHSDPVKTLGSTVSSANLRYAEETGETKEVVRSKRGEKNKLVLDANGEKIMEKVIRPIYRYTRRFSIRPVESGVKYGDWIAPADGALIARTE